jgi:hypothetical protein
MPTSGAFVAKISRRSSVDAAIDLEQADDPTLIELISRGSMPAFITLFDRTVEAVHAQVAAGVPEDGRISEILAASYVEVWWLAGCRPAPEADVAGWITGIVRRRVADVGRGRAPHREGLRPSTAELELASLLARPPGHFWQGVHSAADGPGV